MKALMILVLLSLGALNQAHAANDVRESVKVQVADAKEFRETFNAFILDFMQQTALNPKVLSYAASDNMRIDGKPRCTKDSSSGGSTLGPGAFLCRIGLRSDRSKFEAEMHVAVGATPEGRELEGRNGRQFPNVYLMQVFGVCDLQGFAGLKIHNKENGREVLSMIHGDCSN